MMDRLTVEAAEAAVHPGFPKAEAVLIVELDGAQDRGVGVVRGASRPVCRHAGASDVQIAKTAEERARFWKGRKAAFAAMGRVSPNYYVQDGVIPRTKLPTCCAGFATSKLRSGLRIGNVFHAGDGNLHPLVCYDESVAGRASSPSRWRRDPDLLRRGRRSITGEHGVGATRRIRCRRCFRRPISTRCSSCAARSIRPASAIPRKVFPTPRMCGEVPGPYREHPAERAAWPNAFDHLSPTSPDEVAAIVAGASHNRKRILIRGAARSSPGASRCRGACRPRALDGAS
jgi:glycolate oxidase